MPFLLALIGGVFCFLHILLLGVVIAYNPASYTHLAEGLGRTGASLVISSVYAAENAVAAIVLAVLVFPLFIPLAAGRCVSVVSGCWAVWSSSGFTIQVIRLPRP